MTPTAHDPSLTVISILPILFFLKNFKPTKCLKTGEQLNKPGYIYFQCYEAFKIMQNCIYGVITTMKIQKLTSNLCIEK